MALKDDVIKRIPDEIVKQRVEAMPEFHRLAKSLEWAENRKDMKRIISFKRQIADLGIRVIDNMAHQIIASWEHEGTITQHVSTDRALDYALNKIAIMATHELMQSFIKDVIAWYNREGVGVSLDGTNQDPINKASCELYDLVTKEIEGHYGKMNDKQRELWTDEADRIYSYVRKRIEVFHRKMLRLTAKEVKAREAATATA